MPPATKKRPPLELEPGEGKAHEMREIPEEEVREGSEEQEGEYEKKTRRKRSAKGVRNTKAPMDAEGCSCGGGCPKCAKRKRSDALTAPEYLAACALNIQDMPRTYIRARLDTESRLDLKCGKGSISKGEKCQKGPSIAVQAGQTAKKVGLGVLEAGKWVSGYNIGKTIASGITQGKNEKASTGQKAGIVVGSTLLLSPIAGLGAARRLSQNNDLKEHAENEKREKKWRRSVGYKDSIYAEGFKVNYTSLSI